MTHPNREELAGRLEEGARAIEIDGTPSQVGPSPDDLREAAAALRQSPSVEEVARVIRRHVTGATVEFNGRVLPGFGLNGADEAAQAIAALYGREG